MTDNEQPPEKHDKRDRDGQFTNGNKGGPFKKGISGNPGGRRKGDPRQREGYQRLAKRYSVIALRRLAKMMEDPNVENEVRRKCAVNLIDRAWGKPTESVDLSINSTLSMRREWSAPAPDASSQIWRNNSHLELQHQRALPIIDATPQPAPNGDDSPPH